MSTVAAEQVLVADRRRPAAWPRSPMTPVSIRAPTMTNSAREEGEGGPLDLRRGTSPVVRAGDGDQQRRRRAGRRCWARSAAPGAATNPAMTSARTTRPWTSRRRVADGLALVEAPCIRAARSVRRRSKDVAEHDPAQAEEHDQQHRDERARGGRRKSLKVRPARLAMMMFGGSPTRVAVPPMLEANTSAIRNGTGGQGEPVADQQRHRGDEQHGGDVVEQGGGDGGDDDQHGHHPEGPARARFTDQIARYSNMPVCFSTPTIIIMPDEQEDDVPVDARGWEKNAVSCVADRQHQPGAAEGGGDPVDLRSRSGRTCRRRRRPRVRPSRMLRQPVGRG